MKWLLDTVAISQAAKPRPNTGVLNWLAERAEWEMSFSVVTLAELRFGISRMPAGRKQQLLERWLEAELMPRFEGRILDVHTGIADLWGRVCGKLSAGGKNLPLLDSLIGATALFHGLIVVTCDEEPFRAMDVPVENPWS